MKAVTEFPSFTLTKGLATKTALTAEGKTAEEIQASIGETFKLEGDKLKHFINAVDVAGQNGQNLKRVMVVSLNEGEAAPAKAVKVEEHYYIPEMLITSAPAPKADTKGGKFGGRGGKGGGQKSSPWGLSPEEKAAKGGKAAAKTDKPQA
jgi:hypothetical protein